MCAMYPVAAVIGERFPQNRASAAAQLASQRVYQGGVSAGISGATADTASSVSSIPSQSQPRTLQQAQAAGMTRLVDFPSETH